MFAKIGFRFMIFQNEIDYDLYILNQFYLYKKN
jgi:hypothetical protein